MGRVTVAGGKPAMEAPVTGIVLADIAEGSIVKLNENGSPVEFYVAKHDYESTLNGAGRTLLVRKDIKATSAYGSSSVATYTGSTIKSWMDGYASVLDASVVDAIATTKIEVSYLSGSSMLEREESHAVFPLSAAEYGEGAYYNDGSALPVAELLKVAYLDGAAADHWTRTATYYSAYSSKGAVYVSKAGVVTGDLGGQIRERGARPAFTLPATALFNESTLEFKGVA